MALSDHMPYGAPELLDGASPRMARSTLVSSGLVAIMVWSLGLLAANHAVVLETREVGKAYLFEPKQYEPTGPVQPSPIVHITRDGGDFKMVPDDTPIQTEIETPGPAGPVSPDPSGEPDGVHDGGSLGPKPSPDPEPGCFVYTDELPQLVSQVKPVYPDLAREAGVEGTVRLQLLVGLDGHVQRAIVCQGGSVPMLDDAARAAALATVFTPALANGRPVKVWVERSYRFSLH